MRLQEYAECDATGLAALVRDGEVTAEEVYAAAVEAIELVNPHINAVTHGPLKAPLAFGTTGPFAGVPFVVKDLDSHPQGLPVTWGTRMTGGGIVFDDDSFLMAKFRAAGFAIAALASAPEFGMNPNCEAVAYGSTRNPWDVSRSAGGSSGGTAALVAAGAVPAGHAGDGGGSIRIPSSFNGVVGLKPSRGRTTDGPDAQARMSGLGVEFAITRTMRDCAAVLDAVAGSMPGDAFAVKEPARPWSEELGADRGGLRVALTTESWSGLAVDPEVAAAVEAVGKQLEELGHHVERATPSYDYDEFIRTMTTMMSAQIAFTVDVVSAATGNPPGPDTLERTTLALDEHGRTLTALDMARAGQTVNGIARGIGEFFTKWDLLVTPTVNAPALPLGYHNQDDPSLDAEGWARRMFDVCSFTPVFNWTGTPALSVPTGMTPDGLPIGVQLAAPMCDEATLIRVGSALEEAMPWRGRTPSVHPSSRATS
jgi:amidase